MNSKLTYILIVILIITFSESIAQIDSIKEKQESELNFNNQGEQEDYWAEQLFNENYTKQKYNKFDGEINIIDENNIMYDSTLVELFDCDKVLKTIFQTGLFYPKILNTNKLKISNIEELKFLITTPKTKRLRFYLWNEIILHPTVYFIELTYEGVDEKTDLHTFIKNSELTFIKRGWMIR